MGEDTISGPQLRLMHALFRGVERADRLERISLIVSRRVHSTLDLTRGEATLLIDRLLQEQAIVW